MNPDVPNESKAEAVVLRTMALFATLSTATEVLHAFAERRAGRDPSAQEPVRVVRPYLWTTSRELDRMAMQLQGALAHAEHSPEARIAALLRRFESLITLRRIARLLNVVHQRLLSLYPEVSEDCVEQARHLTGQADALIETDDHTYLAETPLFLADTLHFTRQMRRELAP